MGCGGAGCIDETGGNIGDYVHTRTQNRTNPILGCTPVKNLAELVRASNNDSIVMVIHDDGPGEAMFYRRLGDEHIFESVYANRIVKGKTPPDFLAGLVVARGNDYKITYQGDKKQ